MMVRTRVLASVGAAVAVGVVAFASTAASQNARQAADDPNNANLTYWYWGEDDAPGANPNVPVGTNPGYEPLT